MSLACVRLDSVLIPSVSKNLSLSKKKLFIPIDAKHCLLFDYRDPIQKESFTWRDSMEEGFFAYGSLHILGNFLPIKIQWKLCLQLQ